MDSRDDSATLGESALRVQPSLIRQIAELAMTMDGVIPLYFGESNIPTPEFIKRAAHKALQDGYTFYTSNAGMPSTRRAVARHYQEWHGVTLDPMQQIVITASGVQALNVSIRCLLDPGDEALVLTPNWPNGAAIVQMCNAVPVEIPHVLSGGRFTMDFDALGRAVTPRTRMLLYTSPSNPLGWVANEEEQEGLLEFARNHGLWLMADEVYERLNYPADGPIRPAPTILRKTTAQDAVIVIQSFSKTYCMTGWRLGWLVSRADLCARSAIFNEFTVIHAASFTQRAGEAALEWGESAVAEMLEHYKANRDYVIQRLSSMPGVTVPRPEGAFYVFPKIEGLRNSFEFCRDLLMEKRVGAAPGVAFGAGGEGSIRICYAADRSVLEPAMDRIEDYLRSTSGIDRFVRGC